MMDFRLSFMGRRVMAAMLVVLLAGQVAAAEDQYPSRPITMIVPFPAVGSSVVMVWVIADALRLVLEQPMLMENRGGAGGTIGTAAIAKAEPDGYTIGMGTASTLAINPAAYKNLPYDIAKDLRPIGLIASVPNVMTVNPSVRAKSIAELVALAKMQPGKMTYGAAGNGSVSHLMG